MKKVYKHIKDDHSYFKLKQITDKYFSGKIDKWVLPVLKLFKIYNIKLRKDDGILKQINVSFPKSRQESIVIGLRYYKENRLFTEDLFLFQKKKIYEKHYRGSLEKILPEYKGTHNLQIDL